MTEQEKEILETTIEGIAGTSSAEHALRSIAELVSNWREDSYNKELALSIELALRATHLSLVNVLKEKFKYELVAPQCMTIEGFEGKEILENIKKVLST